MEKMKSMIQQFFRLESSGGILLMIFAMLAIVIANSPLHDWYLRLWEIPLQFRLGSVGLSKPIILWINDGLMAIFFLLVGLELKREFIEGEFSDKKNILLPFIGALGGMVFPALIYAFLNWHDPVAMRGWAIPAATDIAFALGVLSLLGNRVPLTLKIFLTSLAIFDDIGAIVIIAVFYTASLSFYAMGIAVLCLFILYIFNRKGITHKSPYFLVGFIMWVAVLKSGVHATLAGVALAFFIPMKGKDENGAEISPLKELEHDLHPLVAFFILPLFAFANSGLRLIGVSADYIIHSVPLGIAAGLFLGKQLGVFLLVWVAVILKWIALPSGMRWIHLYGIATIAGIGFTMSLFIGNLAFGDIPGPAMFDERLGIILGSMLSGLWGYFILKKSLKMNLPGD